MPHAIRLVARSGAAGDEPPERVSAGDAARDSDRRAVIEWERILDIVIPHDVAGPRRAAQQAVRSAPYEHTNT